MASHKFDKGLDLPISGRPIQVVRGTVRSQRVAVMADDFPGLKPSMQVEEGQTVKRGQVLFEDRKAPGVRHTAPGAGRVIGIHRGEKRALQAVVIDLSDGEREGKPGPDEHVRFESFADADPETLTRSQIRALLAESGLWTSIRERPFGRVPAPDADSDAIFITAVDSHPLAPLPEVAIEDRTDAFRLGARLVSKLIDGPTYLCVGEGSELGKNAPASVRVEHFSGPHPSGTVGVHIHALRPVNRNRKVWHLGYQDVAAIGALFRTGRLDVERVISIAGPAAAEPRLVRTRIGACVSDLVASDLAGAAGREIRTISGSVLSGRRTYGDVFDFLGRFDRQISLLEEDRENVFLGWLSPGRDLFSTTGIYLSKLFSPRKFKFTTSTNGSQRAMVPIGLYEKVMPMDLMPTFLLRSLLVGDVETAERLGVLELEEEDVALCTFVCPGKINYGPILRRNLETIEKEG